MYYLSFERIVVLHLKQTWIAFNQECFVSSLVEIGCQLFLRRWKCVKITDRLTDRQMNDEQQTIRKALLSFYFRWAKSIAHEYCNCNVLFNILLIFFTVEGKFSQPPPKRRYVGVSVMTLTPDLLANLRRRSTNFPSNIEQGIVIASVISGSPAHQYVISLFSQISTISTCSWSVFIL